MRDNCELIVSEVDYKKKEINNNLEYQLTKVNFFITEIFDMIKLHKNDCSSNMRVRYFVETLMNNYAILIELYHSWVVFCHVGTSVNLKVNYHFPYNNNRDENKLIDEIAKKFFQDCSNSSTDERKEKYFQAMSFILNGKFHEIFVLNNLIKHNIQLRMLFMENNYVGSFGHVYSNAVNNKLLNRSFLKIISMNGFEKVNDADNDFYREYIQNSRIKKYYFMKSKIYSVNDIEYIENGTHFGITIESILKVTAQLCLKIIPVYETDLAQGIDKNKIIDLHKSTNKLLEEIKNRIEKRIIHFS